MSEIKASPEILLSKFANARCDAQELKDRMKEMLEAITDSDEYKSLSTALEDAESFQLEIKQELEYAALKMFAATGDKKFFNTLGIRETKQFKLAESGKVYEWVKANAPVLLVVDHKGLKTFAKQGHVPDDIVSITLSPKVTFPKDLSKWENKE